MAGAQLFHLHIPKTAGSSLRAAFDNNGRRVAPVDSSFVYDAAKHGDVDLFSGHAGYRAVAASPALRDRVVTLLRDPFDRLMSYYFHLRQSGRRGAEVSPRVDLAQKHSLSQFLAIGDHPHLLSDMHNAMTWQLVDDASVEARLHFRYRRPALDDADLVALAKSRLESMRVVGFQDRIDDFARAVGRAAGFPVRLGFDNVTPERQPLASLDAATRRRMEDWLELDVAVYDWARKRFGPEGNASLPSENPLIAHPTS